MPLFISRDERKEFLETILNENGKTYTVNVGSDARDTGTYISFKHCHHDNKWSYLILGWDEENDWVILSFFEDRKPTEDFKKCAYNFCNQNKDMIVGLDAKFEINGDEKNLENINSIGGAVRSFKLVFPSRQTKEYLKDDFLRALELMETYVAFVEDVNKKYSNYISLLTTNHNIILHGAPGTGKTYLAREIAASMMFGKSYDSLSRAEQKEIGFVQFHPSYDYTDFVEGLRPTPPNENGQIGFERKDGVFKEFCNKALKKNRPEADNFEEAWENFLSSLEANECVLEIESVSGKPIDVELTGSGVLLVHPKKDGKWTKIDTLYLNHDQVYRVYKGKKGVDSGALDNYRKAVVEKMKKDCGLKDYNPSTEDNSKTTPHVFIIDEINRGDMSKIFGELFFSIDPGYRGVEGTVKTQYANIADGTSRFDEILHNESDLKKILKKNLDVAHYVKEPSSNGYFFIPENVYIIGTMNDIDRSVESMDFAMRRRFVFEEIKAEDSAKNFNPPLSTEALKRMTNLNKAIWDESAKDKEKKGISGLSSAYHIGPAYFKDFKDGDNTEDFWNRRLKGLLSEYLRGTRSAVADLETLHNAFMMKDGSEQSNSETPKQDAES